MSTPAVAAVKRLSLPSKVYLALIKTAEPFVPTKLLPVWNHPAGPKTIFFWAPIFKWSLVIAGLGDLTRPASQISMNQSATLCGANLIWSRYSLIIIPKNWSLFAVCMFTSLTQFIQLARAYNYSLSSEENEKQKIEPLIEAADATTKN